eukprot:6465320-Pyramimonas_sp.AAC.1
MFSEHKPDVPKQDSPSQKRPKNSSWEPQTALSTLLGGAIGEPGRFAAARVWAPARGALGRLRGSSDPGQSKP